MANSNNATKELKKTERRTRLVGAYLLYVAGLLVVFGIAFGVLMYLMSSMMGAGAGPSDPDEPSRFLRNSMLFSGTVAGLGLALGALGWFRLGNPVKVEKRE